jgi:hypothetical protein
MPQSAQDFDRNAALEHDRVRVLMPDGGAVRPLATRLRRVDQ